MVDAILPLDKPAMRLMVAKPIKIPTNVFTLSCDILRREQEQSEKKTIIARSMQDWPTQKIFALDNTCNDIVDKCNTLWRIWVTNEACTQLDKLAS